MRTVQWRSATISLAFVLLAVCVAWVMREQSIAYDRARERDQWKQMEEGRSRLIERLDLAVDEMRRKMHHATTGLATEDE